MVAVNSLLYFLLTAGLTTHPEQSQDVAGLDPLRGIDVTKLCPPNEYLSKCEAHCQKNCTNFDKPFACSSAVCITGCVCKEGMVRAPNGKCVKPERCPGRDTCPRGEHYEQCNAHCQTNCTALERPRPCPRVCAHGCVCDEGTVRGPRGNCIRPDRCPKRDDVVPVSMDEESESFCPPNEVYSHCSAHCQRDCSNWEEPHLECMESRTCVPGCVCADGMVRGSNGQCMWPIEGCQSAAEVKVEVLESTFSCPSNEHFSRCEAYCQKNCSNHDQDIPCKKVCVWGCICDEGFTRGPNGKCIKIENCPEPESNSIPHVSLACPSLEHYSECDAHCQKNCTNYNTPFACPKICMKGCVCNEGLVRGQDGKCVVPKKCPVKDICPRGEHYEQCKAHCQRNCTTWGRFLPCPLMCVHGCVCDLGMVRGPNGKCIKPDTCPKRWSPLPEPESLPELFSESHEIREEVIEVLESTFRCPFNEHFSRCDAYCQKNCSNHDQDIPCKKVCVWGCICDEGFTRGPDKKCIRIEDCPEAESYSIPAEVSMKCPALEHFSECEAHCQKNCTNYNTPFACPKICMKGCVCNEGLVRGQDGKCVVPKKCPVKDICPRGEHYDQCRANCQRNCTTWGRFLPCPLMCEHGCVCDLGTVRGPSGKCIRPETCPKRWSPHPESESFQELDSETREMREEVSEDLPRECFMKKEDGPCDSYLPRYFFNKDSGRCELFYYGGCRGNRNNFETKRECERRCRRSAPESIPSESNALELETEGEMVCSRNEHFSDCQAHCQKNCTNYDRSFPCPFVCVKGCVCDEGYVRGANGKCVRVEQCPVRDTCPRGEHFDQCGFHCQRNCSNWDRPFACPFMCVQGCVCDRGTVRDSRGKCVRPDRCPKRSPLEWTEKESEAAEVSSDFCPKNEEYSRCKAHCQGNCRNRDRYCPNLCVPGCRCKDGYVRGPEGNCIRFEECSSQVIPNEITCPMNERVDPCLAHCQQNCTTKDRWIPCPRICLSGCVCEEGYVRGPSGKCIPRQECREPRRTPSVFEEVHAEEEENYQPEETDAVPSCPFNEHYDTCGFYCQRNCSNWDDEHFRCPAVCAGGCVCDRGFVRRRDGKCVRPERCSERPEASSLQIGQLPRICKKNEVFSVCPCPKTCDNYETKKCVFCVPGCECEDGFVNGSDGTCVRVEECRQKKPEDCTELEFYDSCGSSCPDDCTNYNIQDRPCPKNCAVGCFCLPGYVRGPKGDCIFPYECSASSPLSPRQRFL